MERIRKVKSINLTIQTRLNEVDGLKSRKKLCEKLLADLDPDIKERQKNDRRLSEVESKVDDLTNNIKDIKDHLEKLLTSINNNK